MAKLRAVLARRWLILVVTTLAGVVLGSLLGTAGAPQRGITKYAATQVIVVNRIAGNPANVAQDALKVNRGDVPVRAAAVMGEPNQAGELARLVTVAADEKSSSIRLEVTDTDPERASKLVQAFAAAFLEVVNKELGSDLDVQVQRLQERVTEAEQEMQAFDDKNGFLTRGDSQLPQTVEIDALVAERNRLNTNLQQAKSQLDDLILRSPGRAPYSTLGPEKPYVATETELIEVPESPIFRGALLGTIGLLLGAALVMLVERVNPRIDTRDELAETINLPIIAEIGRIPRHERPSREDAITLDGVWAEHYRRVRSAIQFVQAEAGTGNTNGSSNGSTSMARNQIHPETAVITGHHAHTGSVSRTFLFVSALPNEGKTTSVALTGMALAEVGEPVLLINADFRRPRLETYVGVAPERSLADRAQLSLDRPAIDDVVTPTPISDLWLAASGKPSAEVTSRIEAAKEVASEGARRGATVLIDSSPLRVSNDPIDLLPSADEVILVVRAGRTTVKSIEDTVQLLEMHHAPVLGVILIGTLSTREMYAYYASYYEEAVSNDSISAVETSTQYDLQGMAEPHAGVNGSVYHDPALQPSQMN